MWVIALEALVALALLVIIVWLTMGKSQRRDQEPPRLEEPSDSDDKR